MKNGSKVLEFHRFSDISHIILKVYLILNLGIFTQCAIASDDKLDFDPKIEDAKIHFLINKVKLSKATFLRNWSEHDCVEAADHLETKMKRARRTFGFFGSLKPIKVETFIDKIASESSMSGKAYQIRLTDGKVVNTKDWLYKQLKLYSPQKSENK
jgi:hypothetical protein